MHDLLSFDGLDETSVVAREFYQRPTEEVAEGLLGKILVRSTGEGVVAVRINEVEAYLGVEDRACHTFGGRRTPRTETMWGPAGFAYVYLIYGIHSCLNVVTVGEGVPEAVLIRGGLPLMGSGLIRQRRGPRVAEREWSNGPGKLCQALALTTEDDGADLCLYGANLTIRDDGFQPIRGRIQRTPRIGVDYAGAAAGWPLRFLLSS
jgi:DNA-3-methyladenine glycosylase